MSSNAEQSAGASLDRRQFMQAAAAGAAAAALPAGASAQDGNETDDGGDDSLDSGFNFPEGTITTENQGGAHAVLTESLGEAEIPAKTNFSIKEAVLGQDLYDESEPVPVLIQQSLLMLERCQQNDEQFLSQMFNMMNRARNFGMVRGTAVMIDQINNGGTEQETIDGATTEVDQQYTLIKSNFLNAWTTRVNRIIDQENKLLDAGHDAVLAPAPEWVDNGGSPEGTYSKESIDNPIEDFQLPDGSTKSVPFLKIDGTHVTTVSGDTYDQTNTIEFHIDRYDWTTSADSEIPSARFLASTENADPGVTSGWGEFDDAHPTTKAELDDSSTDWGDLQSGLNSTFNMWMILWDWIDQQYQDVRSNIEAYASEAHQAVEAGEIDVHDLVTNHPAVMASEWSTRYSETGHYSFAAASLGAMGLSYNYENEMVVELEDGSTLRGTLYVNNDDFSFSVGDTINPNGVPGSIYMAYSSDSAERVLESTDNYRRSIDGGGVLLREDPVRDAEYLIETSAGERATIAGSEWEPTSPDAVYNPDYSTNWQATIEDLENPNADISSMVVRRPENTGDNITEITQPFKIQEAYNVESGEPVDEVTGENRTWQTTDVQLTQEQLEAMAQYYDENENYWERTSRDGGGGGGIDIDLGLGGDGLPDWINPRNVLIALGVIVGINAATS